MEFLKWLRHHPNMYTLSIHLEMINVDPKYIAIAHYAMQLSS